MQDLLILV